MRKIFILCLVACFSIKLFSMETISEKKELTEGEKLLVSAIKGGDFDAVHELVFTQKVHPFFLSEFKRNLLHVAMLPSSKLSFDIVNLIITIFDEEDNPDKSSFSVNSQEVFGNTPLHFLARRHVCKNKDHDALDNILKKLCESNADFNIGDRYSQTPLNICQDGCGLTMFLLVNNHPTLKEGDRKKLLTRAMQLMRKNCNKWVQDKSSSVSDNLNQDKPPFRKSMRRKSSFSLPNFLRRKHN